MLVFMEVMKKHWIALVAGVSIILSTTIGLMTRMASNKRVLVEQQDKSCLTSNVPPLPSPAEPHPPRTSTPTPTPTIIPTPYPYPIDTINDGVYRNYEYGFQFEYPAEHFGDEFRLGERVSLSFLTTNSIHDSFLGSCCTGDKLKGLTFLSTGYTASPDYFDLYDNIFSLPLGTWMYPVGQEFMESDRFKYNYFPIEFREIQGRNVAFYRERTRPGTNAQDLSQATAIIWRDQITIFYINVMHSYHHEKDKEVGLQILNSLKFFTPYQGL